MKRVCLVVLALLVMISGTMALAEDTSLTVRGVGVVNTEADCARIVLGVRETREDALQAQAVVNEKLNAIVAALTEAGVDSKDMGTENLYIYANYDYSSSEERLIGYSATNTISITTMQMDKVGEYIDIAFSQGANTLESIYFSKQNSGDIQNEALQLAVQNAYEKAQSIADALGMEIKSLESIDESSEYYGVDAGAKYSNAREEAALTGDSSTMVQASAVQISATVLVEFELGEVAH